MYEAAASCKVIARPPVTNWEPPDVHGMKVQLVCNVTRLRYAVKLRGYDTRLFVQHVTPYRITTLQRYVVTVRGNVTSVDPALSRVCAVCTVQCSVLKMVNYIKEIISEYQRRLVEMTFVPKRSYGHSVVGFKGCLNAGFLIFLFSDKDMGIPVMKDVGLIRSKIPCNTCGRDMTWRADTTSDGFTWVNSKVLHTALARPEG